MKNQKIFSMRIEGISTPGTIRYLGPDSRDRMVLQVICPQDENGISLEFVAHCISYKTGKFTPPENIGWSSLSDGDIGILMLWESAVIRKKGNPIELRYEYLESAEFSLNGIEKGSKSQVIEMYAQIKYLKSLMKFKQKQRGGRKKGSMSEKTRNDYKAIIRHRNSPTNKLLNDEEFLREFPEISRSKLKRAKRKYAEGELN